MAVTINASTSAGAVTTADTSGVLQLQSNGTTALTVDASQNVGVGTASPASKLEVSGSGTLELARFATTTDNTPSIGIYSNGSIRAKLRASTAETALLSQGATPLLFGTNDTERARIDSSGNWYMNSGYGSVAVAYGCRAWVNFNGTGTVAIRASGNVSSITDNGTGDYTVNFTTALPDANYGVAFGGYEYTSSGVLTQSTTSMQFNTLAPNDGASRDRTIVQVAVFR
jgi:hypothetical protein